MTMNQDNQLYGEKTDIFLKSFLEGVTSTGYFSNFLELLNLCALAYIFAKL